MSEGIDKVGQNSNSHNAFSEGQKLHSNDIWYNYRLQQPIINNGVKREPSKFLKIAKLNKKRKIE